MDVVDAFLQAVTGNESGGDYDVVNRIGARGRYQFIQSTYNEWADDPDDWSPEAQDRAARDRKSVV